ncbi:MAG: DmsC/YnfH family molybdoenzyme membrane anchor subunit [Pseudomonadota bacterium]
MHPAVSVIFFTVTSGAGFGLMFLMGLGWPMPESGVGIFMALALAGLLSVAGLLSSTFHLGHPERAWRAVSQWRSSWLSREGVLAIVTLLVFGVYAFLWFFFGVRSGAAGVLMSVFAAATVFATAMIYAQLKTVPMWQTWLTPACYLAFSLTLGLVLAGMLNGNGVVGGLPTALWASLSILLAWALKMSWWNRAGSVGFSTTGSSVGSATGLGAIGDVKLFERPHTGENYLTREMVHQIGRKHASKLRLIAVALGALVPVLLMLGAASGMVPTLFLALAALSLLTGLFAERWLFFAEAKHAVSLYY